MLIFCVKCSVQYSLKFSVQYSSESFVRHNSQEAGNEFLNNLHHLQAVKIIFVNCFQICTFKEKNGGKLDKFGRKSDRSSSAKLIVLAFCNSDGTLKLP